MTGPLAGRRIVVTRSRRQASTLSAALKVLGAEVIEIPLIEIVPPASYAPLDQALRQIARYQWLIITSANTIHVLAERMKAQDLGNSTFGGLKTIAIGPATAAAMRQQGWRVDLIPHQYVAESVVTALKDHVRGSRILLARASMARDVIPGKLTRIGAEVDIVEAYSTVIPTGSVEKFQEAFGDAANLPDAVTFTSSSTVKHFFALLHEAELTTVPDQIQAISIGPITSATLREMGWEPAAEAEQHDVSGLTKAVARILFA